MSGNILTLIAIAIIVLFVGFGFLLGLLRGFRKSMYFTIVFIIVVVLSFVFATMLAKSVYAGATLWKFAKRVIPSSAREGAEGVNSLKEYVRFYITKNYTEVLDNGMTAGQSIVANENAMGIIDGLLIMILKIAMLIGSYIVLTVAFYIIFGLIYLLFLRQKPYIEETTITDEDGNETTEEREVKPKKKRLLGGIVGGVKGLAKAMIILIPMTFVIGMIAQVEVPTNSSVSITDAKLASSSSKNSTLKDVVEACRKYDNSIGKMQFGLDDFVMDRIVSYDVKGADGKTVKVVLGDELEGFIKVYNTIEKEIGVDNLSSYNIKNNISSSEMRAIVKSISENLSNSKATTTLLTAVGSEATVILKGKATQKDKDAALLFEELDLTNKSSEWWKEQIAQLSDIYNAFADMNLDLSKADTKEYNAIFAETEAKDYEAFVDAIFDNELLSMTINGGLKYAVKKLPESYGDVTDTTNQVIKDDKVNEEFKAFSKLVDFIREDIQFKDGSVDTDQLKVGTLRGIVDTEILIRSKIVGKLMESVLKNTLGDMKYDGTTIGFNKEVFNDANFSIHHELDALVKILEDGYGPDFTLGQLNNMSNVTQISQICKMLESDGMKQSVLGKELFSKTLQTLVTTMEPESDYSNVTWVDELSPMAQLLNAEFKDTDTMSSINLSFDKIKLETLDAVEANIKNSVLLQNKMANSLAEPMSTPTMLTENKISAWNGDKWQAEMPRINKVIKTLANENNEIVVNEINLNGDSEIKRITFEQIEDNIAYSEALQNTFKSAISGIKDEETNPFEFPDPEYKGLVKDEWWDAEITGLLNVVYAQMDCKEKETGEAVNAINLNALSESEETYAGVVRSLSAQAKYRDTETVKVKHYSTDFTQSTNIGVSAYLQYIFKPNFKDLSTKGGNSYTFTDTYNWDYELGKIMNVFLITKANYVGGALVELEDSEKVKFEQEVNFRLLGAIDCGGNGEEAAIKNLAIIEAIKDGIDNNTYLQYVLAPEMKKMMSQTKDSSNNYIYIGKDPSVTTGNNTGWTNDEWNTEITCLANAAKGTDTVPGLITSDNPKMEGINLASLTDDQVDLIGNNVSTSYLLQSKMADSLEAAGMPRADIRDKVEAEWVDGRNQEYEALWAAYKATRA